MSRPVLLTGASGAWGRIAWAPGDGVDGFAGQLAGRGGGNPVAERQGGAYCAAGCSRDASLGAA